MEGLLRAGRCALKGVNRTNQTWSLSQGDSEEIRRQLDTKCHEWEKE